MCVYPHAVGYKRIWIWPHAILWIQTVACGWKGVYADTTSLTTVIVGWE